MRALHSLLLVSTACLALDSVACEPRPVTQVIVEVYLEPGLQAEARSLSVRIENESGDLVLDRNKALGGTDVRVARIPIVPRADDPTRRYVVRAALEDASGVALAELEARSGFVEEQLRVLSLTFHDACRDKLDCGDGRTCHHGECRGSCFTPHRADESRASTPNCRECETCARQCQAANSLPCGCPGETCSAGSCTPAVRVVHVSAAGVHTCAVLEGGEVRCWGKTLFGGNLPNTAGRLGTGPDGVDSPVPVFVDAKGRGGVSASGSSTCTIDLDSRYCWGLNFKGELGGSIGSVVDEPHRFTDAFSLDSLDAGFRHSCGLTPARDLWCWGYNARGNLGLGHVDDPVMAPALVGSGYANVAAGGDHTCAVDVSGSLFCWGYNDSGEVGVPGDDVVTSPVKPGCEPQSGSGICFQDYQSVSAGAFHSCALRAGGELYCWGGNQNGQVGIGPPTDNFQVREPTRVNGDRRYGDVRGGRQFTCALDTESALYCWGMNEDGQLGIPGVDFVGEPTAVPVEAPGGWRRMGLGEYHTCAIRQDRTLWCWGRNSDGQVGIGTATELPVERPRRVCF